MRKVVVLALLAMASPIAAYAQAPSAPPISRDQVRTRVLDGCVYDMSRGADPLKNKIVATCSCYSKGVAALMSPEEIVSFARNTEIPGRIEAEAEKLLAGCS